MRYTITNKIIALLFMSIAIVIGCSSEPARLSPELTQLTNPETANNDAIKNDDMPTNVDEQQAAVAQQETPDLADSTTESTAMSIKNYNELDGQIVAGKKLSIPKITGSVPVRDDAYHDTDNNAIAVLQSPTKAMADFPRDRRNEVNWVKSLDQGFIEPRADVKGETEMMTMDLDILMKNTQFMPWVRFPHLAHTKWLACENCHPKIFIPKEHANPISMNKVLRGEFCGVCHDKVAFALFVCERCHSVPHEGSGPAWWKE